VPKRDSIGRRPPRRNKYQVAAFGRERAEALQIANELECYCVNAKLDSVAALCARLKNLLNGGIR
jgi:hypothetical protein